jgi:hypothetical protein
VSIHNACITYPERYKRGVLTLKLHGRDDMTANEKATTLWMNKRQEETWRLQQAVKGQITAVRLVEEAGRPDRTPVSIHCLEYNFPF